jgi:hypothetical protein
LQNDGTCAWEAGFRFNIIGGESMGAVAVVLNQSVQPGSQYEFSVPMTAPTDKSGEIKGTWQLSDANGNYFGDAPWVLITVGGAAPTSTGAAATGTPAGTSTPTIIPTATQ